MRSQLPHVLVRELEEDPPEHRWLIRSLWTAQAVGCISGHPKLGKTWLGLDMAISVASGTPCLGRFEVDQAGPALIFLAEDPLPTVRGRVSSICRHRGVAIEDLDLHVITAPFLRLDRDRDLEELTATVEALRPRVLLLDPFVRLHQRNENSSTELAGILTYLRGLQRTFELAVMVVHHWAKERRADPGQSLRGSGDFWAFGDSYVFLARRQDRLILTAEHRSAPAPDPVPLRLITDEEQDVHLAPAEVDAEASLGGTKPLEERVLACLRDGEPVSGAKLRQRLQVKNKTLWETLSLLEARGVVSRGGGGWIASSPVPHPSPAGERSREQGLRVEPSDDT